MTFECWNSNLWFLEMLGMTYALEELPDLKSLLCSLILFGRFLVVSSRHAGHCWRRRDELISDVLLWTPTYGRTKAGRPARTYIQQLCEDMGCSAEDLPEAMNDREKWRERVRDIRATNTTWWWWWWWFICIFLSVFIVQHIYIYIYTKSQKYLAILKNFYFSSQKSYF